MKKMESPRQAFLDIYPSHFLWLCHHGIQSSPRPHLHIKRDSIGSEVIDFTIMPVSIAVITFHKHVHVLQSLVKYGEDHTY